MILRTYQLIVKITIMKKYVLMSLMLVSCLMTKAQMPEWVMRPAYDSIYTVNGARLIACDSLDLKVLWSMDGRRLSITADNIRPFKNGYAVATQRGTDNITGFYDVRGNFIPLSGYKVAHNNPYFYNGYLLARRGNGFAVINTDGVEVGLPKFIDKIYPCYGGVFAFSAYENADNKNHYNSYLMSDFSSAVFSYGNKVFSKRDVDFISSMNEEGMGIVLIKGKAYYYYADTETLEPVFASENETDIKHQVHVSGNQSDYMRSMRDSVVVMARAEKKDMRVNFVFDKELRPKAIYYLDRNVRFPEEEQKVDTYSSPLAPTFKNERWGISKGSIELLPPQFEEIGICVNDFAAVLYEGKWGMITFEDDRDFRITLNDGMDIAFRHEEFKTKLKLDLPASLPSEKCRFTVPEGCGCIMDKVSLETKDTEHGNYVMCDCVLTIPEDLPDALTRLSYPVNIIYDGIKLPVTDIMADAWHYKYINVNFNNAETILENGDASFMINITKEVLVGEPDYPFSLTFSLPEDPLYTVAELDEAPSFVFPADSVSVAEEPVELADSIAVADSAAFAEPVKLLSGELFKISESIYKFKLSALKEGVNKVIFEVKEGACPPYYYPFEFIYTKPSEENPVESVRVERVAPSM